MQHLAFSFFPLLAAYIAAENRYRFRTATTLKLILTGTLFVCLTIASLLSFSIPLALATAGMCCAAVGDFFLQYIKKDTSRFIHGIRWFALAQICNLIVLHLVSGFSLWELVLTAVLLGIIAAMKFSQGWDTSAVDPWLTGYTALVAFVGGKGLSMLLMGNTAAVHILGLGAFLFYLSDLALGIWNYRHSKLWLADVNWVLYFSGQFLLTLGYTMAS